MHGVYKRTNSINVKADRGVKLWEMACVSVMENWEEYRTPMEEIIASLAAIPERSDTADCQFPKPRGEKIGDIVLPIDANKLSEPDSAMVKSGDRFCKSHIIMLIEKIKVPAFIKNPFAFSYVFFNTEDKSGRR